VTRYSDTDTGERRVYEPGEPVKYSAMTVYELRNRIGLQRALQIIAKYRNHELICPDCGYEATNAVCFDNHALNEHDVVLRTTPRNERVVINGGIKRCNNCYAGVDGFGGRCESCGKGLSTRGTIK